MGNKIFFCIIVVVAVFAMASDFPGMLAAHEAKNRGYLIETPAAAPAHGAADYEVFTQKNP